ncbi:putative non-specific serine/threonine protein kinase [Helianthus annuus]|uniref:Non-specific serine/threonine protein kinase n=2 Tax=Helianthus annuus TaxID=4232 RepID=A0A251T794_HELAN|nr:probable LRR receptor-like serine/threonine-protein kinase At1g34110 isoform X1 [Helianthus annuus]KAF5780393.1 putative non-specific serine/threonine protein kinase [Helianthus annuus]KAJ0500213.1 putative non-specific serine/threonine protein kinase [Helianthus annuus]KAJ0507576.1 putative non-specific serine/threonine protein kinase [Helianthus annuus]KAJ0516046.1 putative non-specific serine/threonine protein kinase [Helianthus annuus]KAJ0629720.1 putative non-specific serine/threonine 
MSPNIIIFIIFSTNFYIHTYSLTHWEDIQSLKHFRNGVVSTSITPGSCLSTWDFTVDPCDSLSGEKFTCGIRCDVVLSNISRITEISLDRAGYSGSLTSSSWNLPFLQTLDLASNYFSGPIPGSFSRLTRLTRLSVSTNLLNGSIPDSPGSLPGSLEELLLDNNGLHGPIPLSLNGLKNLKRLELQGNQLSGEFPELTQLGNLSFLDVSNNVISGYLPASFPASLIELAIRNNSLQGNIPANIINNSVYLQVLDLSYNNLTGEIPAELFTHPSLQQLTLAYNRVGSIETPDNWGRNSVLIAVDLSNNDIHGFLPEFMGWMPDLSALSLENNKFSGVIPTQYAVKAVAEDGGGVGPFERLLLGGNYLFGLIPGPFLQVKNGSGSTIRLGDNCLYECPASFWFCGGGVQKSVVECRSFSFSPVIP